MRRFVWMVALVVAGSLGIVACHEHFDAVDQPDLDKRPETFGFDLSAIPSDMSTDMSGQVHPDLAKLDQN